MFYDKNFRNVFDVFNAKNWKLFSCRFMVLLKWQYSKDLAIFNNLHLLFLIVRYSSFQINETLESWHNWLLSNWSRLLTWKGPGTWPPFFQIVQKIPESYYSCLYLSIGQVWWLNELWFKRYIQKCTLSHVLIPMTTEIMGLLKIQKLEYLENGTYLSTK